MPLRSDQAKQLVDWCSSPERAITATCPLCGKNDWTTGEVFAATPVAGFDHDPNGEGATMVQIICDHCKLVLLLAAPPIFEGGS